MLSSKGVTNLKFWTITLKESRMKIEKYCQKIRRSHLPKEICRQYLPSAKHYPTLKTLQINMGIFSLSMKIYKNFFKKTIHCLQKEYQYQYQYKLNRNYHVFKNKVVRKNTKQPKQSGHCSLCLSRLTAFAVSQ